MKRILLVVILTIFSSSAMAEWILVSGDDYVMFYAEKSTVRKNKNMVKMWSLANYASPVQSDYDKPLLSSKSQHEYDCINESKRLISLVEYSGRMGEGEVLFSHLYQNQPFKPIVPDTMSAALFKTACLQ